jgi:imidazoleglycerol-phosphate dehydratase
VPLDEALSRVVIDFSGRPGLVMDVPFTSGMIGSFDTQLIHEFFQGFVNHALGHAAHRQPEGRQRAPPGRDDVQGLCRALRMALERDPRMAGTIPSTKGSLFMKKIGLQRLSIKRKQL